MEKLNTFKNQYTDPIAMRQGTGVFGKINPTNQTASYSPDKRIYNDWIIQDYLDRGIIAPGEVRDIRQDGYKQVVPQLWGQDLLVAGKKKGPLATVPGSRTAPNVLEPYGLSDDRFKQDPYRTYNHGYRYNNYGLLPLQFG